MAMNPVRCPYCDKKWEERHKMETLEQFVERLSKNVGCYHHKNQRSYSLKKFDSNKPKHMGVFGWVIELKLTDRFRVSTFKKLADKQGVNDAAYEKEGAHYISKNEDYGQATGLYYFVTRGSNGEDFKKVARALKVMQDNVMQDNR